MSEQTITKRGILNCAVIEASPEKVFEAFTTAESLAKFFGNRAEFDRKLDGEWRIFDDRFPEKNQGSGKVVAWQPPNLVRLKWSWYKTDLPPTEVTYRILPHENGTLLLVQHHGWGTGVDWDYEFDDHSDGWPKVISALATLLGATLIWATPASGAPDAQTAQILQRHRDQIRIEYDRVLHDRDLLQKSINKLKKSTGVINLKEVDRLEQEYDRKDYEAHQLELDLKDVELLMK